MCSSQEYRQVSGLGNVHNIVHLLKILVALVGAEALKKLASQ